MSKIQLSYIEPMYSTLHRLANAGIPAKQNKTSDNWYYNNTIHWRCDRGIFEGEHTLRIDLGTGNIADVSILDKLCVNMYSARHHIIEIIKNMIQEGYYVAFDGVDDYYIKGKGGYMRNHFDHDGMILGFDDDEETFMMAAYDENQAYKVFDTPQSNFVEGMYSSFSNGIFGNIFAVKVKDDEVKLDLAAIYESYKLYLAASLKIFPFERKDGYIWGIMVYDYLCMYLDKLIDGSIPYSYIDTRVFRFVWEHKRCGLGRVLAIEKELGLNNRLSNTYEQIVKLADKARMICLKFNMKPSIYNLESIQDILMKMKQVEICVINELVGKIGERLDK